MKSYRSPFTKLLTALAISVAALGHAEESPVPPPKPPFVAAPPTGTRWVMNIAWKNTSSTASASPTPADTVKKSSPRPVRLEILTGLNEIEQGTFDISDGTKTVFYANKDFAFVRGRKGGSVYALSQHDHSFGFEEEMRVPGFPGTKWLAAKYYAGIERIGEVDYYKFRTEPLSDRGDIMASGPITAWVRVSDRIPLRVQFESKTYTFSGGTPYPQNIEVPPEIREKISQIQAQLDAMEILQKQNSH